MKKLLVLALGAVGIGLLFVPSKKERLINDIVKKINGEAARQGKTVDEKGLRQELSKLNTEVLTIFNEFITAFIERRPDAIEWIKKLKDQAHSGAFNTSYWEQYEGIIFGS